jgi:glycosyltransferase involved in cell wall biosynthesis
MPESTLRILVTLIGDVHNDPFARVKYGLFIEALQKSGAKASTLNADLHGFPRVLNAMRTYHPTRSVWRERFWKNVPAFEARSRYVSRHIHSHDDQWDVAIQLGATFDAGRYQQQLPVVIYTDYTARLSADRPEAGRTPFSEAQRDQWIERETEAYHHALHIFTRSQLVEESIIHDYGISPDKVTAIGGGVNFDPLPMVEPRVEENPVVLFIGKEFHRKGGDILLDSFAKVREEVPRARLRMMTQGPIPADLPMEGVDVVPPTWERDAMAQLYKEADLFVLPSRLETWGDVLLEAMAYGLPCIGVDIDAMGEIIQQGETGILVPPHDHEALADALICLLHDPLARARMGQAGRQSVEKLFTWDCVVARMFEVLNQLIGEKN